MIQIKTPDEIALMREAGLVTQREPWPRARGRSLPGSAPSELDTDRGGLDPVRGRRSLVPRLSGLHRHDLRLPSTTEVVHGIPSWSRVLAGRPDLDGLRGVLDGWHGDSAITVGVGAVRTPTPGLSAALSSGSLWRGWPPRRRRPALRHQRGGGVSVRTPQPATGRLRDRRRLRRPRHRHRDAPGPVRAQPRRRPAAPRLVPGLALAVEPMVTLAVPGTRELADGWTVVTTGRVVRTARWEHTVAITEDGPLGGDHRRGRRVRPAWPSSG